MRIFVRAKTGAKEDKILKVESPQLSLGLGDKEREVYEARVKALPIEGRANDAIIRLLAERFGVSPSQVRLLSGATSKSKVFSIPD